MHSLAHYFNSVHWRIQLWHGLLLAVILIVLLTQIYRIERQVKISEIDRENDAVYHVIQNIPIVNEELKQIKNFYQNLPEGLRNTAPEKILIMRRREFLLGNFERFVTPGTEITPEEYRPEFVNSIKRTNKKVVEHNQFYIIFSPNNEIYRKHGNVPSDITHPQFEALELGETYRGTQAGYRTYTRNTGFGYTFFIGMDLDSHDLIRELRVITSGYLLAVLAFFALAFAGGWMLTTRALKPIKDISREVRRMSISTLSARLDFKNTEIEFHPLIKDLNSTFARLEKAYQRQKQFIADASHELRTPITVILSQAQLALSKERSVEQHRAAHRYNESAAEHMRRIVENLLLLARLDSQPNKSEELIYTKLSIANCTEMFIPVAQEKNIAIKTDLVNANIRGEATEFDSILNNLISNAIAYGESDGSIIIESKVVRDRLTISVKDQGIGISQDDQNKIFDRFFRVDKSREEKSGFAGLGLAIVKEFTEHMGGEVRVESELGKGTTFTLLFPLAS